MEAVSCSWQCRNKHARNAFKSGIKPIKATVSGNVELDLINAGLLPQNIFKGMNIRLAEKYELYDWWYETEFENIYENDKIFLEFEGVDTIAEYWLNDKLIGTSDNMLIGHSFDVSDTVIIEKKTHYMYILKAAEGWQTAFLMIFIIYTA